MMRSLHLLFLEKQCCKKTPLILYFNLFLLISFQIRETSFLTANVITMHWEILVIKSNEAGAVKESLLIRRGWRRKDSG